MFNQVQITGGAFALADQAALNDARSKFRSGMSQLFADAAGFSINGTVLQVHTAYLPESITSHAGLTFNNYTLLRQDVKKRKLKQIPKPEEGQYLVVLSAADEFEGYFHNSAVIKLHDTCFVRFGVCNFTQDETVNPFTDANMIAQNYVTAYFEA